MKNKNLLNNLGMSNQEEYESFFFGKLTEEGKRFAEKKSFAEPKSSSSVSWAYENRFLMKEMGFVKPY